MGQFVREWNGILYGRVPRNNGWVNSDDRSNGWVIRNNGLVIRNNGCVPRNNGCGIRNNGLVIRNNRCVPRNNGCGIIRINGWRGVAARIHCPDGKG